MNEKPHVVRAGLLGFIATAVYVPAITIAAELVPPLKNWLAATYGHHWVGKGIIMIMAFVVFFVFSYAISKARDTEYSSSLIRTAGIIAIVSSILIFAFFLYEHLSH